MRRKLWIVLTAIVASLAMAFGISACSLTMNESTMTKEQLEAPVVTLSESGIASWEAVPHAMSYVYKVDEGEEVSVFTRYAQLEDGQTIVVKAKGNALRYSDSPYSVPVTYHATPVVSPDPEQLATPVVSVSEEGLATWEEVENASGYMYKLNGGAEQLFEGETLEYQLEDGQSISVMAKGDGKYYSDSDWSEAKLYTAPVVSQPTKLDTPEVTIDAEGIARWNAIENASAYFYKIDGGNETELEGEDLQVQLEKGQSISVMAKGDGERFTDSDWSEAKTYEGTMPEPQPLATPVVSIDGEGLATWDPIPHASGYKYKINGEEAEHVFEGETLEYQLQDNEYIEVKAFSNDAEHYTDSGWGRSETYHKTPVIPTMLAKPVVALEGNVASWAKDPNAVRYEYVITEDGHDGEPVFTEGTSVELEDGQTIKVKAIGDGTNYSDSDWSNAVTYHETHTELTPLATPEVTIDEEGKATWPAVAGAKGYICKVNGEEKPEQEECEITLQSGDTLQVKAVPSDAEKNTESEYSELQTYTKQTEEKEGLLATFELGDDDTNKNEGTSEKPSGDGTATKEYTEDDGDYKLVLDAGVATDAESKMSKDAWDNKGNGVLKFGSGKNVGVFTLVVPEGVTKVVLYIAGYKDKNVAVSIQSGKSEAVVTLIKDFHSQEGKYQAVEVTITGTTEEDRTIKFSTLEKGTYEGTAIDRRCKINTIEFYGEPVTKLEKLQTPEVKIDKDGNATWEAVPNASSYKYKVNDVEHTLEASAKLEVKLTDKQSITVQAVGDGETYSDSDWSAVKTYTAPVKLGTPEVSISDNGLASWKPIENVTHYEYIITKDGVAQPALTTSDTSVQLEDGWSIKVKAIGDGEHFLDGEYSKEATYTAPEEITLDVPEVTIGDDGKATWTEVKNATGYKYKINDGQEVSVGKDAREVELQPGQSIQVMAVGNNDNIKDSAYSAPKTYTAVLEKPVVSLDGNVASWQAVTGAKSYLYKIGEEGEEKPITGEPLQVELEDGQTLYVKAVGDGTAYSDSPWSDPVTYTAPTDYGTEDAPLSVSEALALAEKECPSDNTATKQMVYAKGIVVEQPAAGSYLKEVVIKDEASDKTILIKTLNYTETSPDQNDIITIYGYIKNYSGVLQFATNAKINVEVVEMQRGQSSISVENDGGATVEGLDEGIAHNGDTITFTVTVQEGYELVSVKANGTTLSEQEGKYSYEVHGDVTIQVKTQVHDDRPDVKLATFKLNHNSKGTALTDPDTNRDSKYDGDSVTTYSETSGDYTLTITGGSTFYVGAYDEKGNAGFKLGTKTNTGTFTITVPEDVTMIVFYVAGYNQSDTTFTINGDTFNTNGESEGVTYHSADGTYKEIIYRISADTSEVKFVADGRLSINTIEFWGKGEIEKPALASPTLNVNQNTGEVTWEKVDGATGYTYTVNGENEQTIEAEGELKVTLENNDEISVIAKGDGTTYSDSAPATATYTHEHAHKSETLQKDANGHWYECVGCDEHLEKKGHEYAEGVCSECQYAHPDHKYSEELPGECNVCHLKHTGHTYEDRNGKCHTCFAEHTGADHKVTTQKHDATNHWLECEVCGAKDGITAHTHNSYDYNTNQHWSVCECGEKVPNTAVEHTKDHTYTEDPTAHWDVCVCGKEVPGTKAQHTHDHYDIQEKTHQSVCSCGAAFGEAANHSEKWANDANNHWKVCSVCAKELTEHTTHTYGEGEQHDHCTACGYNRTHVHEYEWTNDDTQHWEECKYCHGIKPETEKQNHTYVNGVCSNENCHHEHGGETHKLTLHSNPTHHWNECDICHLKEGETAHSEFTWQLGADDKEGKHQHICGVCKQVADEHDAQEGAWDHDGTDHWHKCAGADDCILPFDAKTPHGNFAWESVDDTYHQQKCECGYTTNKVNHGEAYQWQETEEGQHYQHCDTCGHNTAKAPHSYDEKDYVVEGDTGHYRICECGHHEETEGHNYNKDTADGICTKCEHAHEGHAYDQGAKDGKCTTCGKEHDHSYGDTYQQTDDGKHYQVCGGCGYETEKTEHIYDQPEDKCVCGKVNPDAEKIAAALTEINEKLTGDTLADDVTFDATKFEGVKIAFTCTPEEAVTYDEETHTLTIDKYAKGVSVTLNFNVSYGTATQKSVSKMVKIDCELPTGTSAESPLTVEQAKRIIDYLESGKYFGGDNENAVMLYVEGYVTAQGTSGSTYIKDVYISSDKEAEGNHDESLLVYRVYYQNKLAEEKGTPLQLKDKVVVQGYLQKFNNGSDIREVTYNDSRVANYPQVVTWEKYTDSAEYKFETAMSELTIPKTLYKDYVLPELSVEGVTLTVEIDQKDSLTYDEEARTLVVHKKIGETAGVTITVTFHVGGETQTKEYPVTVAALGAYESEAKEVAKLSFTSTDDRSHDGSVTSYNSIWTAQRGDHVWTVKNFNNNSNKWNLIKTGHGSKDLTAESEDGPASITVQLKEKVAEIVANISITPTNLAHVKGFYLLYSAMATTELKSGKVSYTLTDPKKVSLTMISGNNVFEIPSGDRAENLYYQLVIEVESSSNGIVELHSVTYSTAAQMIEGPSQEEVTAALEAAVGEGLTMPTAITGGTGAQAITTPAGLDPHVTYTFAVTSENGNGIEFHTEGGYTIEATEAAESGTITVTATATYTADNGDVMGTKEKIFTVQVTSKIEAEKAAVDVAIDEFKKQFATLRLDKDYDIDTTALDAFTFEFSITSGESYASVGSDNIIKVTRDGKDHAVALHIQVMLSDESFYDYEEGITFTVAAITAQEIEDWLEAALARAPEIPSELQEDAIFTPDFPEFENITFTFESDNPDVIEAEGTGLMVGGSVGQSANITIKVTYTGPAPEGAEKTKMSEKHTVTIVTTKTDDEIVQDLLGNVLQKFKEQFAGATDNAATIKNGTYDLPVPDLAGYDESLFDIEWKAAEGTDANVASVNTEKPYQLVVTQGLEEKTFTLTVIIVYNDGVEEHDFTITVPADENLVAENAVKDALDKLHTKLTENGLGDKAELDSEEGVYTFTLDELTDITYKVVMTAPQNKEGFSAQIVGNTFTLNVVRGDADVDVTLTFTIHYKVEQEIQVEGNPFTVTLKVLKNEPDFVEETLTTTITPTTLGSGQTKKINEIEFTTTFSVKSYYDCSNGQMLYNTTAIEGGIVSILIKYASAATGGSAKLTCSFGNSVQPSGGTVRSGAASSNAEHTFGVEKNSKPTYFCLESGGSQNSHIASITITYKKVTANTDQGRATLAANAISLSKTELSKEGDFIDLPTTGLYDAAITWAMQPTQSDYVSRADNKLTVTKLPTESDETVTLTATAAVNGKTAQSTPFTITIKKQASQGGGDTKVDKTVETSFPLTGWKAGTKYTSVNMDDVISIKIKGGSNSGNYQAKGWAIYGSDNPKGSITFTAADGYKIKTITIEYTVDKGAWNAADSGVAKEVNNVSVTYTTTAGKIYMTKITVVYTTNS